MSSPAKLRYTRSHEWVRVEQGVATVGVTSFAQESLGDVVHVEMPTVGDSFSQGDSIAEVESVKAVSDIYAPVSGEVVAINETVEDQPETVNSDCYGDGWLFRIRLSDASELESLLDPAAYDEHVAAEAH